MASNSGLYLPNTRGWRMGLSALLRAETGKWWRTRRWWTQALVWLLVLNGILGLNIWTGDDATSSDEIVELFLIFAHVFVTLGVITITQGIIVGEKRSGTAAWILSKPVSRAAFVLSKAIATWVAAILIIILLQGAIAYLQISLMGGFALPLGPFMTGLGMAGLNMSFYLTMALMLGTFFNSRGPVIGIPIGIFFIPAIAGDLIVQLAPWWFLITPNAFPELAGQVANGAAEPPIAPMITTALWSISFVAVAVRRFGREEF